MRVLINAFPAIKPRTGVGHYITCLYEALSGLADVETYPTPRQREWAASLYNRARGRGGPGGGRSRLGRVKGFAKSAAYSLTQAHFRSVAEAGFQLYHEPNYIPWPCDLPAVVTVHDLSVLAHPEWHPAGRVAAYERSFYPRLRRAAHFIAGSRFTRDEMVRRLGVCPSRVTPVHYGVRPEFKPLPAAEVDRALAGLGLARGYFLYVGTIEPRKNVATLLRAFCELPAWARSRHPLVLAGGWGWDSGATRELFDGRARDAGAVRLGYVPDCQLPHLYNGAAALLYASHYEGFGLPLIEMAACGGAVLASSADAHCEVLDGCAPVLPAGDVAAWRDAMSRLITNQDFAAELRDGLKPIAGRYTWGRCAAETLQVYNHTLSGRRRAPATSRRAGASAAA